MTYSDLTFNDRNAIKRWLQRRRLVKAVKLAVGLPQPAVILDYGAGNGELCKILRLEYPQARIICYEPSPELMAEAGANLEGLPGIEFCSDISRISLRSADLVFCLEVFEHLPPNETKTALEQINDLLCSEGTAIIGVPVEIGVPAIYKGLFRMVRRYGKFDALPGNVLLAFLGRPPQTRPVSEIAPGFDFYAPHLGFDHRRFLAILRKNFKLHQIATSPFAVFGTWLNPEVYFVVKRKD